SVVSRFEAHARRAPERPALVLGGSEISYGELDARANQVAHHLRAVGVGPNTRVGLYLERSIEMVIGILGILKAGAAYVPVDPEYPPDRVSFMLADAEVPVVLTQASLAASAEGSGARAICLDTDGAEIAGRSAEPLAPAGSLDDTAYVIYTSGSTGRPKGVL